MAVQKFMMKTMNHLKSGKLYIHDEFQNKKSMSKIGEIFK